MCPSLQIHLVPDVVAAHEPQTRVLLQEGLHRIVHCQANGFVEVLQRAMSQCGDLVKPSNHPSTVIVSYEDTVLPHSTTLKGDIRLEITIVSSGG